jgi:hypothetical protein
MPIDEILGELSEEEHEVRDIDIETPSEFEDFLGVLTLDVVFGPSSVDKDYVVIKTVPGEFVNKTCKEFIDYMLSKSDFDDRCFNENINNQRYDMSRYKDELNSALNFNVRYNYCKRDCVGTPPEKSNLGINDNITEAYHEQAIGTSSKTIPVIEINLIMELKT